MLRMFSVLAGAVLLAGGLTFAGSQHGSSAAQVSGNEYRLADVYAQIRTGMPFIQLDALGLDAAKSERLPKKALMERFMPTDKARFDALDPAVKDCYRGSNDCAAYIFDNYSDQVLLLVQDGRVTWKMMLNWVVAGTPVSRAAA